MCVCNAGSAGYLSDIVPRDQPRQRPNANWTMPVINCIDSICQRHPASTHYVFLSARRPWDRHSIAQQIRGMMKRRGLSIGIRIA